MEIFYLSNLCSIRLNSYFEKKGQTLGYAVQKFNRLLVNGFVGNGIKTTALTSIPINNSKTKKKVWIEGTEHEQQVIYRYLPFFNIPILRHFCLFIESFFCVLFWGLSKKSEKAIVCDVLNVSICMGGLIASKLVGIKSVGIVTDMPGNLAVDRSLSLRYKFADIVRKKYISSFSLYVFLTEQMNGVINIKKHPYIIMEGLVDNDSSLEVINKEQPRTILYAGGLLAIYGIQMLIDAVKKIPFQDVQLVLYGAGKIVDDLKKEVDPRIVYKGVASNDVIIAEERKATLLVNPRPTHELFTQYSFPSKNMEYMVSGTPLITTKLPGMPEEYYPYVFLFEEETTEGYTKKITEVLSLSDETLFKKGLSAREFVLKNKNKIIQAARIIDLINEHN